MLVVNKSLVTLADGGSGLIGEASTLGLAPGDWPDFVSVVDDGGSGFLFAKGGAFRHGGEFAGYTYRTQDGRFTLTVFND